MKLNRLFSYRGSQKQHYMDIVYEWEDILVKELDIKLHTHLRLAWLSRKIPFLDIIVRFFYGNIFEFKLNVHNMNRWNSPSMIPCIIDFYLTDDELPEFERKYSQSKLVLISSLEVCQYLKEHHCNLNIQHLALSISDKYKILPYEDYHKEFDLVLMGRQNPVLLSFLKEYVRRHKDFKYVETVSDNNKIFYQTNDGKFVSNGNTREEYISLMKRARCMLYTTPSIDGTSTHSNGYNQITPRFLECVACGCHIIARYKNNEEAKYYEIDKISPFCSSYDEFEQILDNARVNPPDMKKYKEYIVKHYTSVRAKQLKKILENV